MDDERFKPTLKAVEILLNDAKVLIGYSAVLTYLIDVEWKKSDDKKNVRWKFCQLTDKMIPCVNNFTESQSWLDKNEPILGRLIRDSVEEVNKIVNRGEKLFMGIKRDWPSDELQYCQKCQINLQKNNVCEMCINKGQRG